MCHFYYYLFILRSFRTNKLVDRLHRISVSGCVASIKELREGRRGERSKRLGGERGEDVYIDWAEMTRRGKRSHLEEV